MRKMNKQFKTYAYYENSAGIMGDPKEVTLDVLVWIDQDDAGFELYDVETGGNEFHAEGMLEIGYDGVLYGYDGVFELPKEVLDVLKEMDIDITKI